MCACGKIFEFKGESSEPGGGLLSRAHSWGDRIKKAVPSEKGLGDGCAEMV